MYSQKAKITKNPFEQSISQAKIILSEYSLCDHCTGRLFSKKLGVTSNKLLGKKIKNQLQVKSSKNCYICKEILSNLDSVIYKMFEKSSDYQFSSFVIGAILKPSVTDRDDLIRSKFKLQGIDSIKTSITKELSKKFAKKTRKKIDFLYPDLTIAYNFKDDSCELQTKSLIFSGRYIKKNRGLPQKQTACSNCKGKGCIQCNNHGFSDFTSIEGKIAKFLFEKFSGKKIKISWIGGEDKNSLVLGTGRPFFAKLLDPKKRKAKFQKKYALEGLEIHNLKFISKTPKQILPFRSTIKISVSTESSITQKSLNHLKTLKNTTITIHEKPKKTALKFISQIRLKKSSQTAFSLWITADGGVPIKRFIEGKNVHPNVSELLGIQCKCQEFDFHKIDLIHDN